ncbi:MAG: glycosyltransferase [Methanosarcina sp.]
MSSLLALSFHPAFYPPKSGGEERLYNIYNNLSKHFKVKLITFTYPNSNNVVERFEHNENFTEIRIPKTKVSAVFHHFVNRCSDIKECSAVVTSIESRFNKNFKQVIKEEIEKAETVIFVYPYLYTVSERFLENKKIIYESHNLEYELMKEAFSGSSVGKFLLAYIYQLEKSLSAKSNCIFAVSEENKAQLSNLYGIDKNKVYVSPNGVNPEIYNDFIKEKFGDKDKLNITEKACVRENFSIKEKYKNKEKCKAEFKDYSGEKNLGGRTLQEEIDTSRASKPSGICTFIGSYHPPNIEAIENIEKIALKMPDILFLVAGNASQYFINSGLVEKTNLEICNIISKQKITLEDGFYGVEYWESIPTIWCKPQFAISVSGTIEFIELNVYSSEEKELKIKIKIKIDETDKIEDKGNNHKLISFDLKEGWNRIKIDIQDSGGSKDSLKDVEATEEIKDVKDKNYDILFESGIFKNDTRSLSVAVQEISYSENGNIFKFDLSKGPNQPYTLKNVKNVILLGRLSDEEKQALYRVTDIALNPMTGGSGTNIKMLDYMAAGLPVISSSIGARGLDLENYKNAIICEISEFPGKISQLLGDKKLYKEISHNGRRHVEEKFDWSKIASEMVKVLGKV